MSTLLHKPRLLIHGGAGPISSEKLGKDRTLAYLQALEKTLKEAFSLFKKGASALDVVERAVLLMEDCPLFNAGKGSVLNHRGEVEMDASVMDGKTLLAGAVSCVTNIRNPIVAARAVLEHTPHCLLCAEGAEELAKKQEIAFVESSYFITEKRKKQWQKIKDTQKQKLDHDEKHGTVGAVAIDSFGHLAAATSTGGLTNKMPGRVSDSALIGAGTYADNRSCAVSTTGMGDYFIRQSTAKMISDLITFGGKTVEEASAMALQQIKEMGGEGGLIAIDGSGVFTMPFNTQGMFRGMISSQELNVLL